MHRERLKNKYGYLVHGGIYKLAEPGLKKDYIALNKHLTGKDRKPYYDKFWKVVRAYLTHVFSDAVGSFLGIRVNSRFGYLNVRRILCTKYVAKSSKMVNGKKIVQKIVPKDGYHTYFQWQASDPFINDMWRMNVAGKWKKQLWEKVFVENKSYLDVRKTRNLLKTA